MISKNYKASEICLNEMGAVWATDNRVSNLEQELTDFYGLPRKGGEWSRQRQNFIDYLGRGGLQFATVEEARKAAEELT